MDKLRNFKIYNLLLKKNFKKLILFFLGLYKINHKNALPKKFFRKL